MTTFSSLTLSISFHFPQPRPQGAFPWLWGRPAPKAREKRPGDEVAFSDLQGKSFFPTFFSFITVRKHSMCDFDKIRKGAENTEGRANGQGSRAVTKHCWCLLIGQNYYFFFPRKKHRSRFWLAKTGLTMPFQWLLKRFSFFSLLQRSTAKPDPQSLFLRRKNKAFAEKTHSYLTN